jgi:hypothetical protein
MMLALAPATAGVSNPPSPSTGHVASQPGVVAIASGVRSSGTEEVAARKRLSPAARPPSGSWTPGAAPLPFAEALALVAISMLLGGGHRRHGASLFRWAAPLTDSRRDRDYHHRY